MQNNLFTYFGNYDIYNTALVYSMYSDCGNKSYLRSENVTVI